jgi:dynein heavy chain
MRLEDVIFVSAMTSGSGRQPVSERTLRHFTYHSYTEMDSSTMDRIFTKLCQHGLQRFNEKVRNLVPTLVSSVIKVHNVTRETLLPTPLRPHYTFNLRDVWKVFQGICSASHRYIVSEQHLGRLWYHELVRGY